MLKFLGLIHTYLITKKKKKISYNKLSLKLESLIELAKFLCKMVSVWSILCLLNYRWLHGNPGYV